MALAQVAARKEPCLSAVIYGCIVKQHVALERFTEALAAITAMEEALLGRSRPHKAAIRAALTQQASRKLGYPPADRAAVNELCAGARQAARLLDPEAAGDFNRRIVGTMAAVRSVVDPFGRKVAVLGAAPGWEHMLSTADLDHKIQESHEMVGAERSSALAALVPLLVKRGLIARAMQAAALAAEGCVYAALWTALRDSYRLNNLFVVAQLSAQTLEVVLEAAKGLQQYDAATSADVYALWCRGMAAGGQLQHAYDRMRNTWPVAGAAPSAGDPVWCALCDLFLQQDGCDGLREALDCADRVVGRALLRVPPALVSTDGACLTLRPAGAVQAQLRARVASWFLGLGLAGGLVGVKGSEAEVESKSSNSGLGSGSGIDCDMDTRAGSDSDSDLNIGGTSWSSAWS